MLRLTPICAQCCCYAAYVAHQKERKLPQRVATHRECDSMCVICTGYERVSLRCTLNVKCNELLIFSHKPKHTVVLRAFNNFRCGRHHCCGRRRHRRRYASAIFHARTIFSVIDGQVLRRHLIAFIESIHYMIMHVSPYYFE